MTADTARDRGYRALEEAISAFMDWIREENDDCDDVLPVDAVLIVGTQWFDDDGDRSGNVTAFPRNGSQPYYTTLGLVEAASHMLLFRATGE